MAVRIPVIPSMYTELFADATIEGGWPGYLKKFRQRIMSLGLNLSPQTAMIAGGSVVKALIGDYRCLHSDIDIFTFTLDAYTDTCRRIEQLRDAKEVEGSVASALNTAARYNCRGARGEHFLVEVISPLNEAPDLRALLTSFDITVCRVATDGDTVHFLDLSVKTHIKDRTLEIHANDKHKYGMSEAERYRKYYDLGFRNHVYENHDFYKYFDGIDASF